MKRLKGKIIEVTSAAMEIAESIIATIMLLIVFLGIGYLGSRLISIFGTHFLLDSKEIHYLLDIVLTVFIIVELFRITIAYILDKDVIHTVLEAALVALARKIILYEFDKYGIYGALALSILTVVLVIAYYMVGKEDVKRET